MKKDDRNLILIIAVAAFILLNPAAPRNPIGLQIVNSGGTEDATRGIYVEHDAGGLSSGIVVTLNTVTLQTGYDVLVNNGGVTCNSNTISYAPDGLYLMSYSDSNTFNSNNVNHCTDGYHIASGADNNNGVANTFSANGLNVHDLGSGNNIS